MYYTQLLANDISFGTTHFRNTRPVTILHHRRTRRCVLHSTAACFTIFLRGDCSRWERCLHAGGAVVQFCREIPVCWPQCPSTGFFCGTAVQSDPHPAPLFAHFFWQGRKSESAKQWLRLRRIRRHLRRQPEKPAACGVIYRPRIFKQKSQQSPPRPSVFVLRQKSCGCRSSYVISSLSQNDGHSSGQPYRTHAS